MLRFLARLLSRSQGTASAPPVPSEPPVLPGLHGQCAALGLSPAAWVAEFRQRPALYADLDRDAANSLAARFPKQAALALAWAESALAHTFDLLGSGPFTPCDPGRPAWSTGYRPLDWYLDPVRGLRFPEKVPHKEWNLYSMRPGNADVKYPWELARCQHFAALGQAWRTTGQARFAREVADQIEDFMEANPVGLGINWTCTMDVAIRAANWAIGLGLTHDCPELSDDRLRSLLDHLFAHGTFIAANFEDHYEVTSNHYLSNVVGLFFLAVVFRGLPEAAEWDAYCRERLEREMGVQVLPDGADFESSVPYHRLVLELFLGAARLATWQGSPLSPDYHAALNRMAVYLGAVLTPERRMPVAGDADDGRLHVFSGGMGWDRRDALHVLAPAALHRGDATFLAHAREADLWEAAWWGFDVACLEAGGRPMSPAVQLFPEAGHAVFRDAGTYLLVTNSIVGTKGFGNHKHNDQLAFELHLDGAPLVVDPGSYVYTSDFASRNRFRSTVAHATLMMDGVEQNETNPEWIFRLFETARAEHLFFREQDEWVEYGGLHHGYERLETGPVTHVRGLRLYPGQSLLLILDLLMGNGRHRLSWRWPLAPGVIARLTTGRVELEREGGVYFLEFPREVAAEVVPANVSPSYGVQVESTAVEMTWDASITGSRAITFALGRSTPRSGTNDASRDADWADMEKALGDALRARNGATMETGA